MYNNNWFKWSYSGGEYSKKSSLGDLISISLSTQEVVCDNFHAELKNTVLYLEESTRNILLTGYPISQAMLRSFVDSGVPAKAFIPKFSNLNLEQVKRSQEICERYNIKFTVVDLNLEHFFKAEAYDIFDKSFTLDVKKLPIIKIVEMINLPVLCSFREPFIVRDNVFEESPGSWNLKITEDDLTLPSYFYNTQCISDFFFYRKELVKSYIKRQEMQDLINGKIPGRISSFAVKVDIFESIWPGFTQDISVNEAPSGEDMSYISRFFDNVIRGKVSHSRPLFLDASKFN